MNLPSRALCILIALGTMAGLWASPGLAQLQTKAEATDFTETATHADVMEFSRALASQADRVVLGSLGESHEGRDLPLLIVADPPIETPEQAAASGKMVALLIGNIHAGEVCGKEALLMLARDLGAAPGAPILDDFVVLIAPIYNADGNERMAPDNRPGQDGPARMGVRPNAQGFDLNRDFIKNKAPETLALLRAFRQWDPDIFIDAHTTNGSHHRYVLTYSGPKHPGGDVELVNYVRDTMLPRVQADMRDTYGHETFTYGNFAEDHTEWTTFPAAPRYSTNYFGMRNRIGILSEAYSYAPFKDRVIATRDFCRAILDDAAANRAEIEGMFDAADEWTRGSVGWDTPVRTIPIALEDTYEVKGWIETEENGRRVATDEPKDYEVEVIDEFVGRVKVDRPWAYIIPGEREDLASHLRRHGLDVEIVREDAEIDAEVYTFEEVTTATRTFQGHRRITANASASERAHDVRAGDFLVEVGQDLGSLAVAMLEPEAEDSLVSWNFFEGVVDGETYPIVRLAGPSPLLTTPLPPLAEDRGDRRRITWDLYQNRRQRPNLSGSAMRSVEWRDDDHYIVSRAGRRWLVEAATGRYVETVEPEESPSLSDAIEALPGIDSRDARRIRVTNRAAGLGLFTHAGDLFAVSLDGAWARRLTATPEEEELATLSPTGEHAAFVRAHDLYIVETETGIERRLTTTGTEKIRNGKHAWVYFEEIFGRNWKGYWWSPDGAHIAFYETDSTDVDEFVIVDNAVEPQVVEITEYPKPGSTNPEVRLGLVAAGGGEPRFVDLSSYTAGSFLVSGVGWLADSSEIFFTIQDRAQTWLDLCTIRPTGGTPKHIMRDRTDAWITTPTEFRYLSDGSILVSSERSGWDHLYRYSATGELINQVTEGPWEFRGVIRLDEDAADGVGEVWFNCTADSPIGSTVYAVRLDGTGLRQITSERGTHRVSVSPEGSYVADFWSNAETPDRAALLTGEGEFVRWLDTNPVYALDDWDLGRMEMTHVPISRTMPAEGPLGEAEQRVHLEAQLFYPPDFDPSRKYPVWFLTYAGPHAPTVRDTWSGARLNERMLANSGFIVLRSEPYSASGKGARSAWVAYERLGQPEMEDIDELMVWMKEKPYVDHERIGMSGFSYGGFMTAFAMTHSEHFAAGIAGGSVTSWYDYDTIYTERYMNTPQENPEGYEGTNVVAAAKNLHGNIMIVHGMMDDNVHLQNATKLVRALQDANKDFEMLYYPRFRHGIWAPHYQRTMYEFQMRLIEQGRTTTPSEAEPAPPPAPPAPVEAARPSRSDNTRRPASDSR